MDMITGAIITQIPFVGAIINADWLFTVWVIVTIIWGLDLVIPDPIPFIDEMLLGVVWFLLLGALFVRWLLTGVEQGLNFILNPGVLAFLITITALILYTKFGRKKHGRARSH
jgi:hypothetical protein